MRDYRPGAVLADGSRGDIVVCGDLAPLLGDGLNALTAIGQTGADSSGQHFGRIPGRCGERRIDSLV